MIKWEKAIQDKKHYHAGMYGGKFIPFHRGHEYCLKVASQLCDKVYCILFYGSDQELEILKHDTTLSPKYLNLEWRKEEVRRICALFPNIQPLFIDVTKLKTEDGREDWDAETPLVLAACGKFDAVFSSEINYDEYFQRAYPWADHVIIDPPREIWPISATKIRNMTDKEAQCWLCE